MGENLIAMIRHLTGPHTPLLEVQPTRSTVYFSFLGKVFIMYPAQQATLYYATLLAMFGTYLMRFEKRNQWPSRFIALLGVPASLVGALLSVNTVALLMTLLNKTLSWYR